MKIFRSGVLLLLSLILIGIIILIVGHCKQEKAQDKTSKLHATLLHDLLLPVRKTIADLSHNEDCYACVEALKIDKNHKIWLVVGEEALKKPPRLTPGYLSIKRNRNGEYFVVLHYAKDYACAYTISEYNFHTSLFAPVTSFEVGKEAP